eukprot:6485826-Amphidinium_carterae.1
MLSVTTCIAMLETRTLRAQHSGGTLALDEGRRPRQRLTVHADLQLLPIHADPLWIDVRVT